MENNKENFTNLINTIQHHLKSSGFIFNTQNLDEIKLICIKDKEFRGFVFKSLIGYYRVILDSEKLSTHFSHSLINKIEYCSYSNYTSKQNYNSENYYKSKIKELEQNEKTLKEILVTEKDIDEKIISETNEKLGFLELELIEKKKKLEAKEKEEDAKSNWETKIKTTFTFLGNYLEPIKKEHKRLESLYSMFGRLFFVMFLAICVIEGIAIYLLKSISGLPTFENYLIVFMPLPIAAAFMWGFIFQMNRAQRQLVVVSNKIHSIDYIQGLLIAINTLSPNIDSSINRINEALDKIISNHLDANSTNTEEDLLKEEKKDTESIDLKSLSELIKTIKKI